MDSVFRIATARRMSIATVMSVSSVNCTGTVRSSITRPYTSVHLNRSVPLPVALCPVLYTTGTIPVRSIAADGSTMSAAARVLGEQDRDGRDASYVIFESPPSHFCINRCHAGSMAGPFARCPSRVSTNSMLSGTPRSW